MPLSNGPGKKGSNFFCYGAVCFPHIGMFSFSNRECINYKKALYAIKNVFYFYINSIFKGWFFVSKDFDQS